MNRKNYKLLKQRKIIREMVRQRLKFSIKLNKKRILEAVLGLVMASGSTFSRRTAVSWRGASPKSLSESSWRTAWTSSPPMPPSTGRPT